VGPPIPGDVLRSRRAAFEGSVEEFVLSLIDDVRIEP
jgi:hypothetical protein